MKAYFRGPSFKLATCTWVVGAVLTTSWPRTADACGGFFCDGGGPPMPVDQTGETIVFVLDGTRVEAHIQINYQGEASKFSWVIPVMSEPTFAVGSQPLLNALLVASQPQWFTQWEYDQCGDPSDQEEGDSPNGTGPVSGGGDGEEGGPDGGPRVVSKEIVGAFEAVVLQGGTAQELIDWLDTNGYAQDPEAEPIFEQYLAEGALFAALKLTGGTDVDEIHPIALTFDTGEACVPLRLTRIAAVEDMEVRSFFLAPQRVAPTNYRHVLVNPARIDWLTNGANYSEVVTLAVDEDNADGRAFVTEYAGTPTVVPENTKQFIFNELWDDTVFVSAQPTEVMGLLQAQNMGGCFGEGGGCQWGHPLVLGLLRQYLPAPPGVAEDGFYADPLAYTIDMQAWDGPAFAHDYRSRIIDAGRTAADALEHAQYLTRMYTTISPHEMTDDPVFHVNADLIDVPNVQIATARQFCSGARRVTLPDGREIQLEAGQPWPDFGDEMPWSEAIETVPEHGAPQILVDNTEQIDNALVAWNESHAIDETDPSGSASGPTTSGCACTTMGGSAWSWLLVGLGGMLRSRRRPL